MTSLIKQLFFLESAKPLLGFDDRKILPWGILIVSVWIFLLLFSDRLYHGTMGEFFTSCSIASVCYTFVFWIFLRGGVLIMRYFFPKNLSTQRRLMYQLIGVMFFYVLVRLLLSVTLDRIGFLYREDILPNQLLMRISELTVGALVLSIYEGYYFYSLLLKSNIEKEQLQRANMQSQLEGLKNQVNPHFLFNSLNTLTYIIPRDHEQAVRFVQQLSKVYRYILEIRDTKLIALSEELAFIEAYIFLLKERFGDNISININVDEKYRTQQLVPLSLQILFENAIKHNIISTEQPLHIEVFGEDNQQLIVRNNLQKKNQVMNSTKVGLDNIKNRYQFFTDEQVKVITTSEDFIVVLPLINVPVASEVK